MKVLFTPSARAQFLHAVSYILADDPPAAVRFRKRVDRALGRLKRFPKSGRHIPEFPDLPFREIVVPPYRFFYRPEGKSLWVVACWHGAQLPATPEKKV
jgi:toxin ParE1/3/4